MDCRSDDETMSPDVPSIWAQARERASAWIRGAEEGTAMTEFVIMLPVFVIIFSGVVELADILQDGVRTKARASSETWSSAMEVFNDNNAFQERSPRLAGLDAAGKTSNGDGGSLANNMAMMKNYALMGNGTEGEANLASNAVLTSSPSGSAPGSGVSGSDFPAYITDDSSSYRVSSPRASTHQVFQPAYLASQLSGVVSNQSFAAGIRYGMVQESVDGNEHNISAGYDVLLSPVPVDGVRNLTNQYIRDLYPVGFSRLSASADNCLSSVLAIEDTDDC